MNYKQNVTLRDMVAPQFRGMKPQELEFCADGSIARRDRWEQGIRTIAGLVGLDPRKTFEISEVVEAVRSRLHRDPPLTNGH